MHVIKGAIHVHSNYSQDSEASIEDLAKKAKVLSYDFIILADHFEDMDEHILRDFLNICKKFSAIYNLNIIPGVEVRLKTGIHILIMNIKSVLEASCTNDFESLRKIAKSQRALVGLAHLSQQPEMSLDELSKFDFIEAWNYRYDKRFPPFKAFRIAQALRNGRFIGGLDLHSIDELGSLWIQTEQSDIIDGIRYGKVTTKSGILEMDQNCNIVKGKAIYYGFFWIFFFLNRLTKLASKSFSLTRKKPPRIIKLLKKALIG
jgi:hypothetical protein